MSATSTSEYLFDAVARWTGTVGSGGVADASTTTIPLESTTNLTNGNAYIVTLNRVDANGTKISPTNYETVIGVLSGSNLTSCVRGQEGTAQQWDAGVVVEVLFTATHWDKLVTFLEEEHNADGTHSAITADSITLASGATATEFSTDTTMAGDSDTAIPTEKAVKTYVDATATPYDGLFRNAIRNPRFEIAQRGTGAFTTAGYSLDGWEIALGAGDALSVSQTAFTVGQTDVPGNPRYYVENTFTGVSGASNYCILQQKIESVSLFSGTTVTLSFYANVTTATEIGVELVQNFGTGGSPSSTATGIGSTKKTLTGTMTKYSTTISVPSITGKTLGTNGDDHLMLVFWLSAGSSFSARSGGIGIQSGVIRISDVVLNAGSTAIPLQPRTPAEELALNQRYAFVPDADMYLPHNVDTGSTAWFTLPLPTTMRAEPTVTGLTEATNLQVYSQANSPQTGFTLTVADQGINSVKFQGTKTTHGLTNPVLVMKSSPPIISAEL